MPRKKWASNWGKQMRRMDLVASIIILAFSGMMLGWMIPNFVPQKHDAGDLPPSLMPFLSMSIFALTALLLGISAWRRKDDNHQNDPDDEATEKLVFGIREAGNLLLWLAASGIASLLLKFVGFEVAAGALIAAGAVYGGIRNPIVIAIAALIIPQIIDKAAWYGLQIRLP